MSAPKTFEHDTWLYHAADGGRLFLAGQERPGEGWFDHPQAPAELDVGGLTSAIEDELRTQLDEQKTKFDAAWADLTKAKKAIEDENADLRRDIASRDEDIRQLQAQVEELTAPARDTSDAKPAAAKPSK